METHLADFIRGTPDGDEAERILRRCVHCGFCTATCPTYQLLGDELDGPRGRIYLIKQVLEGAQPTARTQLHLDRCLTCRSCESTCPSGVEYARLLDIGRAVVDARVPRTGTQALLRGALRRFVPNRALFGTAMALGKAVRPLLPAALKAKVPAPAHVGARPRQGDTHRRRVISLAGCVQPGMFPNINVATARVLDAAGIGVIEPGGAGCCGAVRHHLSDGAGALDDARRNIDAWWPLVEGGAEAIVINASGCGAHVREYGHLLRHDAAYAAKAARITTMVRDIGEVVAAELGTLAPRLARADDTRIAIHNPCSLQHGQQLRGLIEAIVAATGATAVPVAEGHLCCGSAGTYSILQPELSQRLRDNKLAALTAAAPSLIVSANVGCIAHLGDAAGIPVRHWIEFVDSLLGTS